MRLVWLAAIAVALAPAVTWPAPADAITVRDTGEVAVSPAPDSLLGLLARPDFFHVVRPTQRPERPHDRNPFVLPSEKSAGKPYSQIQLDRQEAVAQEERRRQEERERQERELSALLPGPPIDQQREALLDIIRKLHVTAVLIGDDSGTAVIDGYLLDVGDTLLGGAARLLAVTREGVVIRTGDAEVLVPLPAPKADRGDATPSILDAPVLSGSPEG